MSDYTSWEREPFLFYRSVDGHDYVIYFCGCRASCTVWMVPSCS